MNEDSAKHSTCQNCCFKASERRWKEASQVRRLLIHDNQYQTDYAGDEPYKRQHPSDKGNGQKEFTWVDSSHLSHHNHVSRFWVGNRRHNNSIPCPDPMCRVNTRTFSLHHMRGRIIGKEIGNDAKPQMMKNHGNIHFLKGGMIGRMSVPNVQYLQMTNGQVMRDPNMMGKTLRKFLVGRCYRANNTVRSRICW
ncbi:hypothetical protein NPIL_19031 [Nephila pilipes]|uniref:Uncharacterized protein n=1 Tax=Nephila pilipes TaxID=299642 RepID=A0A8X6PQE8_NEPPI|nr:hypothetical protein NPIL_19031 [Nephila pilipes]